MKLQYNKKLIGCRKDVGRRALLGESAADLAKEFGVTTHVVIRCALEALEGMPGYTHEALANACDYYEEGYGLKTYRLLCIELMSNVFPKGHFTRRFERVE